MFCSRSIGIHLARGVGAFALIALAIFLSTTQPFLAILSIVGAFVLFKGCPMCWIVGLFETFTKKSSASEQGK